MRTLPNSPIFLFSLYFVSALYLKGTDSAKAPEATVEITVRDQAAKEIDQIGSANFDQLNLRRQLINSTDLNQITRTLPSVQFDNAQGELSENSILDLRPSRLSIAGGRVYDNHFQIEGLSTNSVQDTTNTNMHNGMEVVVHPQTSFINPNLIDSVTVYTSDVPAEFGGFTGGVVSAKLRDPQFQLGGSAAFSMTSDAWVKYRIAPEFASGVLPEKPRFERKSGDLSMDLPLGKKAALLLGYSKTVSELENTQRHSLFGVSSRRSSTTAENVTGKLLWKITPENALRVTSIWSPYRQQNFEQSDKFQDNDGWLNKFEFTRTTDNSSFEAYAGFNWSSTDRDQEPDLYTYKYMGSIDWVPSDSSSASRGGSGDMVSRQIDLPLGLRYERKLSDSGAISFGADYQFTRARKQRPLTNSAYRHQSSASVKLDPRVISADGPEDRTVIAGEQALNYRIVSLAFDSEVDLNAGSAWAQWSDEGKLGRTTWSYRAGLRADRDDFLDNTNLSPRLTGQITPFKWLKLNAGANRYYTRSLLAYKLRENYPANVIYTRTGKLKDGKLVFSSADWVLYSESKTTGYGQADLDTPYSDELSFGATFSNAVLGDLSVTRLRRRNKDEFSRDEGTVVPYVKSDGTTATTRLYRITNTGYTLYDATSVAWTKSLRSHRFQANVTFSDTRTSTLSSDTDSDPDYFNSYEDLAMQEEVHYNGTLVSRRSVSLERGNYARPTYVNFLWSSDWFKGRLKGDLLGRWNTSYSTVRRNGTITVGGPKYDKYEDVKFPSVLMADLNLAWIAWQGGRRGEIELSLKVSNLLNRMPNTESASTSDPYLQGRSLWSSIRYSF